MPRRTIGDDRLVEIIVDPQFAEDLIQLARSRPLWVVENSRTSPLIEAAWKTPKDEELCEVNRFRANDPSNPERDFLDILPTVHGHYDVAPRYAGIVVRGVGVTEAIKAELDENGYRIIESTPTSFVAATHPDPNYNTWDFVHGGIHR